MVSLMVGLTEHQSFRIQEFVSLVADLICAAFCTCSHCLREADNAIFSYLFVCWRVHGLKILSSFLRFGFSLVSSSWSTSSCFDIFSSWLKQSNHPSSPQVDFTHFDRGLRNRRLEPKLRRIWDPVWFLKVSGLILVPGLKQKVSSCLIWKTRGTKNKSALIQNTKVP